MRTELAEMESGHLLVQFLVNAIDSHREFFGSEFDLGEDLVGEGATHHETGVAGGAAEIHKASGGQEDDAVSVGEDVFVELWLDCNMLNAKVVFKF